MQITEHFDPRTGLYYIKYTEDVQPLLDIAAEHRNHADHNTYKKSKARWRKIGDLPCIILDQWFREGFNALDPNNEPELRKRLSGSYNKFLFVNKI